MNCRGHRKSKKSSHIGEGKPAITFSQPDVSVTIMSHRDRLPVVLWTAAVILAAATACLRPGALPPAARATLGPFATLAAIITGSVLADRLGVFRALARLLLRGQAPRAAAAASVLAFTALLSGLVNLDVAVVVAMPVALHAASEHHLPPGRLAVAVAITANATSFLLPTANITSLLLLGRTPLPALAYLRGSWLAWLLVSAITIGPLSAWLAPAGTGPAATVRERPSVRTALDLIPMFLAASAIRALLAHGIAQPAGFATQLAGGAVLAAGLNNLPAAAALHPAGPAGLWAAIAATAIGPNLLLTGSVATLIARRIARQAGVTLAAWQFTAIGSVLIPAQLAGAALGLHMTGALH
jgi:Na+/H+ antiporter NhaD/arsenite permease-like protein